MYKNKFYTIKGESGSGKSTLINILGLIDNFSDGEYTLYGQNLYKYNQKEISNIRMEKIGFVFQEFKLNQNLKAFENVMVPMLINNKIDRRERKMKAIKLLEKVGLGERYEHFPRELSGGEQQRVAIARALANDPEIILADEPTGNLDSKNEMEIFNLLKKLSNEGKCIIVVSHSSNVEKISDDIMYLKNKKLEGEN